MNNVQPCGHAKRQAFVTDGRIRCAACEFHTFAHDVVRAGIERGAVELVHVYLENDRPVVEYPPRAVVEDILEFVINADPRHQSVAWPHF